MEFTRPGQLDVLKYDELLEQLDLLQDIHTAERQIESGNGVIHEVALAQSLTKTTELGAPE